MSDPCPQSPTAVPARPAGGAGSARGARPAGAALLVICGAVLGLALYVRPDPRGYGTHEQLGGGPCGMLVMTGLPCPTCGMTTAFAHAVRGQWWRALRAQPAGFVLALATVGAVVLALWMVVRGRWPGVLARVPPLWAFTALLVVLVGGWVVKIGQTLVSGAGPGP